MASCHPVPEFVVDCDSTAAIFFTDNNGGSICIGSLHRPTDGQITLCPSDPQAVQVEFIVFDLQTNPNPNNNDVL